MQLWVPDQLWGAFLSLSHRFPELDSAMPSSFWGFYPLGRYRFGISVPHSPWLPKVATLQPRALACTLYSENSAWKPRVLVVSNRCLPVAIVIRRQIPESHLGLNSDTVPSFSSLGLRDLYMVCAVGARE